MNKKIILFSAFLASMILIGSFHVTSTNAQTAVPSVTDVQNQITDLTNQITALENRRDTLVRNTIINSGCFVGIAGEGLVVLTGTWSGMVYYCPMGPVGEPSPQRTALLAAQRASDPVLLEISGQISPLKQRLEAAYALFTQLSPTTQTADEHFAAESENPVTPEPELSTADLALLAGFDPVDAPEIIEEYHTVTTDPRIDLNGPNGTVKAIVQDGEVLLTEDVELGPGQALEVPQIGVTIKNGTKISAFMNMLLKFIPIVSATPLIVDNNITVVTGVTGTIFLEISTSTKLPNEIGVQEIGPSSAITITPTGISVSLQNSVFSGNYSSSDGDLTLHAGAVYDPITQTWRNISNGPGSHLAGPTAGETFLQRMLDKQKVGAILNPPTSSAAFDACMKDCLKKNIEICLECTPGGPTGKEACRKPTDQTNSCEASCSGLKGPFLNLNYLN